MALYNLVDSITATLGTGSVVAGAAVAGYNNWSGVPNGAIVSYGIRERDSQGVLTQSEAGLGTWNAGISTLSRDTVRSSTNGGSKINLTTGIAEVYITAHAEDFHNPVTIGTPSGLSLAAQVLSLGLASAGVTGALSGADWSTFNGKQPAGAYLTSVTVDSPLSGAGTAASHLVVDLSGRQPLDTGLTSLAGLTYVSAAFVKMTGVDTFTLDTATYEPTITILPASKGGTGINNASATLTLPNLAITLGGGGAAQTYTLPAAGGTFALLNAANVFTALQTVDTTAGATVDLLAKMRNYQLTSGAGVDAIQLQNTRTENSVFSRLGFLNAAGQLIGGIEGVASNQSQQTGYMQFVTFNNGTAYTGLVVTTVGRVGVGITPAFGFHVYTQALFDSTDAGLETVRIRAKAGQASNLLQIQTSANVIQAYIAGDYSAAFKAITTTTNAIKDAMRLEAQVSTASTGGAAGFGVSQTLWAETATDLTSKQQGRLWSKWIVPTNGSETSAVGLDAYYNSTAREFISGEATTTAVMLAFFGGTRVVRGAALTVADASAVNTGDATSDTVINNMRTRINELEARLGSATGVNIFA